MSGPYRTPSKPARQHRRLPLGRLIAGGWLALVASGGLTAAVVINGWAHTLRAIGIVVGVVGFFAGAAATIVAILYTFSASFRKDVFGHGDDHA